MINAITLDNNTYYSLTQTLIGKVTGSSSTAVSRNLTFYRGSAEIYGTIKLSNSITLRAGMYLLLEFEESVQAFANDGTKTLTLSCNANGYSNFTITLYNCSFFGCKQTVPVYIYSLSDTSAIAYCIYASSSNSVYKMPMNGSNVSDSAGITVTTLTYFPKYLSSYHLIKKNSSSNSKWEAVLNYTTSYFTCNLSSNYMFNTTLQPKYKAIKASPRSTTRYIVFDDCFIQDNSSANTVKLHLHATNMRNAATSSEFYLTVEVLWELYG